MAVAVAAAFCAETAVTAAEECIQLHGGIGFTWEHDLQLYFKRARAAEVMLGDATWHRRRVASSVLGA